MKYCWCLLFFLQQAYGQTIIDSDRKPATYNDVSGSPYLLKDWSDGVIRFSNGRVMRQFKLKFDCVRNQLIMQFNGSAFAAESKVHEFVMYPKGEKNNDSLLFRKGFPPVENATKETYYQVVTEGTCTLLRLISKNILEEKEVISGVSRRLQDDERYFILRDGTMNRIQKNEKAGLLDILNDKSEELKKFIAEKNLRMRSVDDFELVVKKYNELIQ